MSPIDEIERLRAENRLLSEWHDQRRDHDALLFVAHLRRGLDREQALATRYQAALVRIARWCEHVRATDTAPILSDLETIVREALMEAEDGKTDQ